jgi:hypothetical protein
MASRGKKKTTMAKLNREAKLRERKRDKQARKEARKAAAAGSDSALERTQPLGDGAEVVVPGSAAASPDVDVR